MDSLVGKIALVTGGGGGIGLAMGRSLAAAGARVILADLDEEAARKGAATIAEEGGEAEALALDVRSETSWQHVRQHAERVFGAVDILCNNAGVGTARKSLDTLTAEDCNFVFDVNVRGVLNGLRCLLPSMRRKNSPSHIVNTGSILSHFALAEAGDYVASKYAVLGISETLKLELRGTDIGVSVLCPGLVDTAITENTAALGGRTFRAAQISAKPRGLSAVLVGAAVVRALTENRFYIFTHPEYARFVDRRNQQISAALAESTQLGPADDTSFLASDYTGLQL